MIKAEKAHQIMQLYESDYDNFLKNLKAKRAKKKTEAATKKTEADKADNTLKAAQAHKTTHLGDKAKSLIDKAGGIEGAKSTIDNVMKYFKTDTPSDFQVGLGEGKAKTVPEKTIMGLPPIAVYAGGAVLALVVIYGISRLMQSKPDTQTKQIIPLSQGPAMPEPVFQQAA